MKARVALTGVSSFTGLWIGAALKKAGLEVFGICTQKNLDDYTGLAKSRVKEAERQGIKLQFGLSVTDGSILDWAQKQPFDLWVHHHHFMQNYRSPDYDLKKAKTVAIDPLPELIKNLKQTKVRGVLYSSTHIETGDLPYGKSKRAVGEELDRLTEQAGIPFTKILIENPIGPLENEDRLIPTLIQKSQNQETFQMQFPEKESHAIPITRLTEAYVRATFHLLQEKREVFHPPALALTNRQLAEKCCHELIEKRLHMKPCEIEFATQAPASEKQTPDLSAFWDFYAKTWKEVYENV